MNFMRNNCGSTSGRRQQQTGGGGGGGGGYSYEEDDEEEKEQMPAAGQLFPSSTSSSPSSSSHQHQPLHPPPPYHHQHHHHGGGGWLLNTSQGGESSSSRLDPMMLDSVSASARPATEDTHPQPLQHGQDDGEPSHQAGMMMVEREHMFDKVVTPSDVGKLNRLVIPKQHAERYFPLDSSTNDKGLLLNFEDRNGKPWRFRYSYWNSSQSYVMTKGWSRFVKEKKLDAGDIVSFQRGIGGSAKDRLFIDWRRRPDAPTATHLSNLSFPHHQLSFHNRNSINIHPWNPLFLQSQPAQPRNRSSLMLQPISTSPNSFASYTYGSSVVPYNISTGSVVNVNQGSVIYFRSGGSSSGEGGGPPQQQRQQQEVEMMQLQQRNGMGMDPPPITAPPSAAIVFESVPVVHGKAAAKRLRLFGVNMDCPISEDAQDYDPSELSPSTAANSHQENFPCHPLSSSSTIPYQQLRPYYGGTPSHQTTAMSSADALNKNKSTSSNMSLDFDI